MIPPHAPRERRRPPRIQRHLPLKIQQDRTFDVTETINLSRSGVYCRLHRSLPEMTRLRIVLSLPAGDGGTPPEYVSCDGVVVRSETHGPGDHRIAIFFETIPEADKEKLSRFIDRRRTEAAG